MSTPPIIRFHRRRPERHVVRTIIKQLHAGQLAVIPSETQYALCGDATSRRAIQAARTLKGRAREHAFSVFLRDQREATRRGIQFGEQAAVLAEQFWPGPLTLVLPTKTALARQLGSPGTIGVRVSPEPLIVALLDQVDCPLLATSANPSGVTLTAGEENRWLAKMAMSGQLIWARPTRYYRRVASTVIDCTGRRARILRDGAIPREDWQLLVGQKGAKKGGI